MIPVTKEDLAMLIEDFLGANASLYDEFRVFVKEKGYTLKELGFSEED
jgi:hypothetical protein